MNSPHPICVRMLAADPSRPAQWRAALDAAGFPWTPAAEDESPDVAIVDRSSALVADTLAGQVLLSDESGQAADAAMVALPADAPPRELATAVRLAAEVTRLRRQLAGREAEHSRLSVEARTDSLTGVANRRAWEERLEEISRQGATNGGRCLAVADIDHFKPINDQHGHDLGDAVLRCVAQALRAGVRQHDLVARLGGDEFGLLLDDAPAEVVPHVLERLRQQVALALAEAALPAATISIGYDAGDGPSYSAADAALRRAKRLGRNRVESA